MGRGAEREGTRGGVKRFSYCSNGVPVNGTVDGGGGWGVARFARQWVRRRRSQQPRGSTIGSGARSTTLRRPLDDGRRQLQAHVRRRGVHSHLIGNTLLSADGLHSLT